MHPPHTPNNSSTILMYMVINGDGGLTGCGLHGCSLVSVLCNKSVQYNWLFLNEAALLL